MKPLVQHTNTLFTNIIDHKRKIATELTGTFLVASNRGNKYIFILYEYDRNCILILPMKSIVYSKFIQVFADLYDRLLTRGIKPEYIRLDNESSPDFQRELKAKNIYFQPSPPRMYRRNAA